MGRDCEIRAGITADLDAVHAIEGTVFTDPWSRGLLAESLSESSLVAARDDGVVGYVFFRATGDEGEILNLAVAADAQERGTGTELLARALAELSHQGVRRVFLEVRESNAAARRFYERQGFREVGRRSRYYRRPAEAALVFARDLPAVGGPA